MPYVWFAVFAVFAAVALYSFRHTRSGYRYATVKVVIGVLGASIALGIGLNAIDLGQSLHRYLLEHSYLYDAVIHSSEDAWSRTDKGFLGGRIIAIDPGHTLTLKDFKRRVWQVDTKKAVASPDTLMVPDAYLKIKGVQTGPQSFHALSIAGWE